MNGGSDAAARCIVRGLVQGVGFRWFVATRARALGVNGFVRNLADGSVEVRMEGARAGIEGLIQDCRRGPRSAHVHGIQVEWEVPSFVYSEFEIR